MAPTYSVEGESVAEEAQKPEGIEHFHKTYSAIVENMKSVLVGHDLALEQTLISFLADGHALLEGVPGLGKTLMVQTLAHSIGGKFSRIQFTPDLMPSDITGTDIIVEKESGRKSYEFKEGPVFGNIVLADEINRATPKTQSALLQAMQEKVVTVGGTTYDLPAPFFVMATQNPLEMEGTYPLPEAQLDRFFFKLLLRTSSLDELVEIAERTTGEPAPKVDEVSRGEDILKMRELVREVPAAKHVKEFAARVVLATQPDSEFATALVKKYVRYGASPRGMQALILGAKVHALIDRRYNVAFDDLKAVAAPALRHRIILNFEGEAEGVDRDNIIREILEQTPELPGK
jgi:MoxR-like ATPase